MNLNGSADLPGIDGLAVDVSGWTEDESNPSQKSWYQPGAALSLNYFPIPPDVTHAVRDDEALRAQYEQVLTPQGNMAVVEASWVDGPHDFVLAQIIVKTTMPQSGMAYLGSLIVPFAECSWVIKMQAVEGSFTGYRESVWLVEYLRAGGDLDALGFVDGPPNPDDPVLVGRMPSDDAEWDGLFPQHPLSRVRAGLRSCRQSLTVSPEVLALERLQ